MIPTLAHRENGVSLEAVIWILISGACCCFSTPLGYVTNLMVQPKGKYNFGDFVRFGGVLQLVHGAVTVLVCVALAKVDPSNL